MELFQTMCGGNIGYIAGVLLMVAGLTLIIVFSLRPNRITVTRDSLMISGNYGYSVKSEDIQSVELLDKLPGITLKRNGIGWLNIKTGHFTVKGIGKCRLYVNKKYPPFVHVVTTGGEHVIFNTKDTVETKALFETLMSSIQDF